VQKVRHADVAMALSKIPLILLAFWLASSSAEFQSGPCRGERRCQCKWSQGKRMADCSHAGFQSVPKGLTPDIQVRLKAQAPG